jgi:hypothetical protein
VQLSKQQELMIQRCVDDELSSAETRALLKQMEEVDGGWKTLACGFLEERLLHQTIAEAMSGQRDEGVARPAVKAAGSLSSTDSAAAVRGSRNWFAHPVTSLTLCAAIAFVSGLLIPKSAPDRVGGYSGSVMQAATADGGHAAADPGTSPLRADGPRQPPRYHVEWLPNGDGSRSPVQVPVFQEVDDLAQELAVNRQLFPVESGDFSIGRRASEPQLMRIPINDSEDILLFVVEQELGLPVQ